MKGKHPFVRSSGIAGRRTAEARLMGRTDESRARALAHATWDEYVGGSIGRQMRMEFDANYARVVTHN